MFKLNYLSLIFIDIFYYLDVQEDNKKDTQFGFHH